MRLWVGLFLACLWAVGAHAQRYAFRHHGAEVGLPAAYAVAFDGEGALLVGTSDGLARYDGRTFSPVALPVPGAAWRLATAPDGAIWGLTNRAGLFRLRPGGVAEAFAVPPDLRARLHEQIFYIRLRVDAASRPWLSDGRGTLYHLETDERWTPRPVPGARHVADFFVRGAAPRATVVVAAWDAARASKIGVAAVREEAFGPFRWMDPGTDEVWVLRPHPRALAWIGAGRGVGLLAPDGAVRWVGPGGEGVWRHSEPGVDAGGRLLALVEGTRGMLLVRYAPDGRETLAAGTAEGLPGVLPLHFAFDPEGGFWGAHAGGLFALADESVRTYPLPALGGTRPVVNGLAGDPARGRLWVTTYGGAFLLDRHAARALAPGGGVTVAPVVTARGDGAWAERISDGWTGRIGPDGRPAGASVLHDGPDGRIETDARGVWHVRGANRTRLGPVPLHGTTGRADAAGRVWLAGESGRLDVVWGDSLARACTACVPPSLRAALDSLHARLTPSRVVPDRHGRVWVTGATGGLGVLWEPTPGTWAWQLFGERDGLLSQVVAAADVSPDGRRLWLATHRGLQGLRLVPGPPRVEPFLDLRARDGLPGEIASSVIEDADGMLWTSLAPGEVHRLDWRALARRPPSPALRVEGVAVNGRPVPTWAEGLRLPHGARLAVALAPSTWRSPSRARLEYRLAGADTAWADLGAARQLVLAALPAGRYRLEARAVRAGQPPGPVLAMALRVAPPWWRSVWFGALLALSAGLAFVGHRRVETRRRQAAEALRHRIAADLHDEVGTSLAEVSLYSALIRQAVVPDGDRPPDADTLVVGWAARVGEQAAALSGAMRDVVWAIRPDADSWDALELRLKDVAVALLAPRGVEADLAGTVEGTLPALAPVVRQNVLLFLKEAVHNAARHAAPTRVEVRWRLTRRALSLRIADDGRGFDPATARRGMGLLSLRRRADEVGGTFRLDSAPGRGTVVGLDVPLGRARLWSRLHRRASVRTEG